MEDSQPNEVRLARKGSTTVPYVRTTRPPYRGQSSSLDSRPSKRLRWQPPLPSTPNSRTEKATVVVEVPLPQECRKGAPGCYNARERWIEDQKHTLRANRHLFVVSFRYLDHDGSVRFTCHTRQATRSTGHHARDSTQKASNLVNARLDREGIDLTGHGTSMVKARGNDSTVPAQNSEPGPSQIKPNSLTLTDLGGCAERSDTQTSVPSSGHSIERKLVKLSPTEIKPRPVQCVHASSVSRHQTAPHTVTLAESVIDLTSDPPGPIAKNNSARWPTFRSGYVDICLPPRSRGWSVPSSEASTDPRPGTNQTPEQVMGQSKDTPILHSSNPSVCANDTVPPHSTEDRQIGGSLSDQRRRYDVLKTACSTHSRDYSIVLEDGAEVSALPPDHNQLVRGFVFPGGDLPLSLGPYDKPRRILLDDESIYIVTAHGIIDQVGATSTLKFDHNIRSPSFPYEEFIDDACILSHNEEPIMVLGHARERNQISLLNLGHGQASRHITLHRDWNRAKKPGVSAVTSLMSSLKFATGGYDHRVHLWEIGQDLSSASAVELAIKHTSVVHSLLPIVDTSHKLVSVGADQVVPIYDMSAERVVQILKMSCTPYHAHKIDTPSCTLLEVSHLETQFEVRDHRKPSQAVQRFGFLAGEKRGRYEKADTWSQFVGCGDKNGAVHLWDLRNVSTEVAFRQCFNDPIVQVVNTSPRRLLACSKRNELACIELHGD